MLTAIVVALATAFLAAGTIPVHAVSNTITEVVPWGSDGWTGCQTALHGECEPSGATPAPLGANTNYCGVPLVTPDTYWPMNSTMGLRHAIELPVAAGVLTLSYRVDDRVILSKDNGADAPHRFVDFEDSGWVGHCDLGVRTVSIPVGVGPAFDLQPGERFLLSATIHDAYTAGMSYFDLRAQFSTV